MAVGARRAVPLRPPKTVSSSHRAPSEGWLRLAALVAVVGVLYGNSLRNDFVWDDRLTAIDPGSVSTILTNPTGMYYRPVVMLSFKLDGLLWDHSPIGFHVTNLACHVAVAWLLGAYARVLGMGAGASLAAAILFAAHPVQTEAVTYISGRTDILCALFALLALLAWTKARQATDRFALASGLALLLSLLSKEAAIGVPLVMLVRGANSSAPSPRPLLPLAVAGAWLVLRALGGEMVSIDGLSERLPALAIVALGYVRLLAWPNDLHLERFTPVAGWSVADMLGAWGAVVALGLGGLWLARRFSAGVVFLVLAVVTYLPGSGLVPVYGAVAAQTLFTPEHFLYLPLLGLTPLLCGGIAALAPAMLRPALAFAVAALVGVWGVIVVDRNHDWRNEAAIFRHTLRYDPPAARVWFNLGNLELSAGNLPEARRLLEAAAARGPHDAAIHYNLAITLHRLGADDHAAKAYRRALELDPTLAKKP